MTDDNWGQTDESSPFCRDYIGTVKSPFFGTNPKIGEGRTLLLNLPVEVEEVFDEAYAERVGEEETLLFSLGKDWETPDGGETAVHGSGNPNKAVHASSAYGMLLDAITGRVANYGENATGRTDQEPLEVDLSEAFDVLRSRGPVTEAAIFDGTRWEFHEVSFDYGKDKEGKEIRSTRSVPTKFLGVAGEDKAKAAAKPKKETAAQKKAREAREAKAAAKEKASASSNGDADSSADPFAGIEIDEGLRSQLVELAGAADDAEAFRDAAYEVDDLMENAEALELIVDDEQLPAVYEALRG